MIYKKDSNGVWTTGKKVIFPDGQVMDENNHDFKRDGFEWHDEPPAEFLKWKDENDTNITTSL